MILIFSIFECIFTPESSYEEWGETYRVNPPQLVSFAVSTAPNGIDIWISGGISPADSVLCNGVTSAYYNFNVSKSNDVIE